MKGQRQTALQLDSDRPAAQDVFEAHPHPSVHIPCSITPTMRPAIIFSALALLAPVLAYGHGDIPVNVAVRSDG